ncbi:MAG TPA: 30S ribosomal protein S18 [Candidatus Dormibacteraeota bacterium]|nr:30S ribosomal protein S18 [Candidatus Dormibacteraeota bacterium]
MAPPSSPRGAPRGGSGEGRPGKRPHRKVCAFCVERLNHVDYKEVSRLRRYISERGKILPRRVTGTCAKHQRPLTLALKRARQIALLPFTNDHH